MAFREVTILGGRGMLGYDLAEVAKGAGFRVRSLDLPEFDITNEQLLRDVVCSSEVIVNCAAYTNVEKAETEGELANNINGYSVGALGRIAKENNVPVIHISTDFVFDGQKDGAYVETDEPKPLSVYGSSKLLDEKLLAESGCTHSILRVQWTYGKNGVNFITKITEAASQRDELMVIDDQTGSPTHTLEVAKVICDMLRQDCLVEGLFHVAANGYVSRYDMTRFAFEILEIKTPVKPCKTSDFKTAAQRPLNSRFNCEKIEKAIGRKLPDWQEMLRKYLEKL